MTFQQSWLQLKYSLVELLASNGSSRLSEYEAIYSRTLYHQFSL